MQSERTYLRVGITGGIGAGKSALCEILRRRGRIVFSADEVARAIMVTDRTLRAAIEGILGPAAYRSDGSVNNDVVAAKVFSSVRIRSRINAAVHPAVIQEILHRIEALPDAKRRPYVIVEAALIYESGMDKSLDAVIVVDASEEIRLGRLVRRDGMSVDDLRRRMKAQMPASKKREQADFVVLNEGSEANLAEKAAFLDLLLSRMVV